MAKIIIPRNITGAEIIPGAANRDSTIDMGERKYAVGGPNHYNLGWTCHTDQDAAVRRYGELKSAGYEHVVILNEQGETATELMTAFHDA